jgi:ribosomal protein L11 methylase PrmA
MEAMPTYANAMNSNSHLLLSGFFLTDVDELKLVATKNGLQYISYETDGEWALIHLAK